MNYLNKVKNLISNVHTGHLYNRALDNVHETFNIVNQAARRLNVEIRPDHRPSEDEMYNTHLPIECRSIKEQIDDHRETAGMTPMYVAAETPSPQGEPERIIRNSVPPHVADVALQAHRAAREATPMRRRAMSVLTTDNPKFPLNLKDYAPARTIQKFRDSYNRVAMAALLPITPETIAHDLREEVILNQGQCGMHISGTVKDRLRYPSGGSQPDHEAGSLPPLSPIYVHIPPWL